MIDLEGSVDFEDRTEPFQAILALIAKESPKYNIHCELKIITAIPTCKLKHSETPDVFAIRYKACVARYINQSTTAHSVDYRQWEVKLLRNAMLTPDTLNSITFQVTANVSLNTTRHHTLTLDASLYKVFSTAVMEATKVEGPSDFTTLTDSLNPQCDSLIEYADRALSEASPLHKPRRLSRRVATVEGINHPVDSDTNRHNDGVDPRPDQGRARAQEAAHRTHQDNDVGVRMRD